MKSRTVLAFLLCTTLACGLAVAQSAPAQEKPAAKSSYVPIREYDPKRDADKDIAEAVKEAQRTKKNVLLEIGGQWCIWCKYFDKFFADHSALAQFRDENYIMVKINFSKENENKAVISKYGKVPGYPHLFVLDKDGKLIHSQDTSKLEEGRGYNMTAVANFLRDWAPNSPHPGN